MPPIALGVQVAEVEAVLQAELDGCNGSRDLTGHEGFAADRTFVVEQDSIRSMDAVGLPVVHRDPVGIELGGSVGRPRIEWRLLILWYLLRLAIEFQIGRAHVCTPVTNAHLVCRLLLEKKNLLFSVC